MATTETRKIQFDFVAKDQGVQKTTKETGESIEGMNKGLEEGSGKFGKLGAVAGKLGPILGTVTAAAALIGPAISKGLEAQDAQAKFRAQLGLTAKESGRIGGVAGKLYSQAYGENMDEVRGAITAVIRNMDGMRTASSKSLQSTTGSAMTLAKVMDEDVGPVTNAVSQMLRTGLAKNAKEAFDVLTKGAQNGANKAEDLLDTFNEYSTQFRDLGLNGAQAMGILQQGLEGGARDADLVADALKEMNIRVQDGTAASALQKLGLNAKEMAAAFGKGGPSAAKAFDLITDKLRGAKTRTEQYTLAQQIFGTQSEDMSRALLKIDPSEATKKLGKFKGATDAAGNAMGKTFSARITMFKRTVETQVTNVATRALNTLAKFGGQIAKGFKMPSTAKGANDWQRFGQELRKVADWARTKLIPALRDLADWFGKKIAPQITKFYKTVLVELGHQLKRISTEVSKSGLPWGKVLSIFKAIYGFLAKYLLKLYGTEFKIALKVIGTFIVYQIKVYGWLWKQLQNGWKIIKAGVKALTDWYKSAKGAFSGFQRVALQAVGTVLRIFVGFATNLVHLAAKAFGWVPGLGGKLKKAEKAVQGFAGQTNKWLDSIKPNKNVNLKVNAKGLWTTAHDPSRRIPGLAKGGPVPALWNGASEAYDSQPALLRVNEHVWTPEEVKDVGGHGAMLRMRAAARKGLLKGFAGGGPVGVTVTPHVPSRKAFGHDVVDPVNAGYKSLITAIANEMAAQWKKYMASGGSVVAAARAMIGYPYSWGGGGIGGPSYGIGRGAGTYGFDCSGLTQYAWWKGRHKDIGGVTNSQWANSYQISGPRPGALGFPHGPSVHVMLASNKPGYVIQAPFTGSFVQEVPRSAPMWRMPKGFYRGGAVGQAGAQALGPVAAHQARFAQALGLIGDPGRHRAAGGPVAAGQAYLVGERGAEVMVPRASGTVHRSGSMVIQNLHVHVNGPVMANDRQIAETVLSALRKAKKQAVDVRI
ncbi:hypothetical protein GCM10009527_009230 [Actinomadura nitritigenes]|uniref:Phage tail tape measure protein n=1 Tax=Actinomadura nitritigenes TaxID=134602 RepID=A0ABS3R1B4_9ACTN|nr:phage tail tape measure protein [Actinomadura nitritigenes]MBO2439802.1 phage tail tape measure protein [Actinomadura nitritigenes]